MKSKFRIRKWVSHLFDDQPDWPNNRSRDVYYTIEQKCFWWWEELRHVHGSKSFVFTTVEDAEKALKQHIAATAAISADGSIAKEVEA